MPQNTVVQGFTADRLPEGGMSWQECTTAPVCALRYSPHTNENDLLGSIDDDGRVVFRKIPGHSAGPMTEGYHSCSWQNYDNALFDIAFDPFHPGTVATAGAAGKIFLDDYHGRLNGTPEPAQEWEVSVSSVRCVNFSAGMPNVLVSGSRCGYLTVTDTRLSPEARVVRSVPNAHTDAQGKPPASVVGASFLGTSTLIASAGCGNKEVRVWDLRTMGLCGSTPLTVSREHTSGRMRGFSYLESARDGSRFLAVGLDGHVRLYDALYPDRGPQFLLKTELAEGPYTRAHFSSRGDWVYMVGPEGQRMWNVSPRDHLTAFQRPWIAPCLIQDPCKLMGDTTQEFGGYHDVAWSADVVPRLRKGSTVNEDEPFVNFATLPTQAAIATSLNMFFIDGTCLTEARSRWQEGPTREAKEFRVPSASPLSSRVKCLLNSTSPYERGINGQKAWDSALTPFTRRPQSAAKIRNPGASKLKEKVAQLSPLKQFTPTSRIKYREQKMTAFLSPASPTAMASKVEALGASPCAGTAGSMSSQDDRKRHRRRITPQLIYSSPLKNATSAASHCSPPIGEQATTDTTPICPQAKKRRIQPVFLGHSNSSMSSITFEDSWGSVKE
eukprot:Clim_evm53s109 gene=Clim_evmTU53s109